MNKMSLTLKNTAVARQENLHYTKWGKKEEFVLAGTGITSWTEDSGIKTDTAQYINEENEHTNAIGYAPKVTYSGELVPSDPFDLYVYQTGKKQLLGELFDAVEVETWAPVAESSVEFAAYKCTYEIQPTNPGSGEGGGKVVLEGTFAQKGAKVSGKFNISTKVFTEGNYDYTTGVFTANTSA